MPHADEPCQVCGCVECRCGAYRQTYQQPFLTPEQLEEMDPEEIEAWEEANKDVRTTET